MDDTFDMSYDIHVGLVKAATVVTSVVDLRRESVDEVGLFADELRLVNKESASQVSYTCSFRL